MHYIVYIACAVGIDRYLLWVSPVLLLVINFTIIRKLLFLAILMVCTLFRKLMGTYLVVLPNIVACNIST